MDTTCLNCFGQRGAYEVCPWCGFVAGTPNAPAYLLQPGVRLWGRYIIGTVLGAGGFGVTYKAWDTRLAAVVAIKEFFPQNLAGRMPGDTKIRAFPGGDMDAYHLQLARFLDEAKSLAKFAGDAHIVSVLDFFEDNGTAYIVMEYLDGETLKAYLALRGGALPPEEAAAVMEGLLAALSSIHKKGVIHRDISPDNLFVLRDGRLKVLDFGAARFAVREDWTQSVVVKKGYAPPEQYRSNMKQGVWTDIYAAGATWYKMLTGQTPEESIERWEKDLLARPSQLGAAVDEATDKAVMKAMALRPELRFKSAEAALAALRGEGHAEFPEVELKKRRRTRVVSVLLSSVAVVTALAIAGWQLGKSPTVISAGPTLADMDIQPDAINLLVYDYYNEEGQYNQLAAAFMERYPGFTVNVRQMPYEEMRSGNVDLAAAGAPTVYYGSVLDANDHAADLSPLLNGLDTDDYYLLHRYSERYDDTFHLPLSFNAFTAFASPSLAAAAGVTLPESFSSVEQYLELANAHPGLVEMESHNFVNLMEYYEPDLYVDGRYRPEAWENDVRRFAQFRADKLEIERNQDRYYDVFLTSGQSLAWEFNNAARRWQSDYELIPFEKNGRLFGYLTDTYYVNKHATENQQLAGMLFLHFLLSEYAQNVMFVQTENTLPLNRRAMEQYLAAYPALAPLEGQFNTMYFESGDMPGGLYDEFDRLFGDLYGADAQVDVDEVVQTLMDYTPTAED